MSLMTLMTFQIGYEASIFIYNLVFKSTFIITTFYINRLKHILLKINMIFLKYMEYPKIQIQKIIL
jgi:hypothetical protein